ncbi:Eco57I restriction-modification methylase [Balneicella halophila]|uniref:site-specific DNA-methyltransferase (adenine-specific) n=1 Tax=Balneicella halophila TaxID=1537566 RepID=A0A7L4UR04_BALHA|nr:N-6 DNA methylase [Balneicella halophila]PVX52196.1 Eco57I restriction-modification methylase [Balneicella halophila]
MSLFQKSVEKKYLSQLDAELVQEKYSIFQMYFGNPEIQENIRNAKEEQFQEGFLRELFVNILGYTPNPQPDFNLTTELKNIANSKKADGAIIKDDNAVAVIELKGTNTPDLDKVEAQAFGYKNHHPKCVYVITSNFEKLRFYIHNAIEYLEFDLFNLTKEQFALLWLCLAKENLLRDIPLKIKESSLIQEENITKELYADYSKFRTEIYSNLVKNNPNTDKLLLFKKTQKLLDRFLFIFFAEDRLLLPPNSIGDIIKKWKTLKEELDAYVPLYNRFKKYFGYMNTGYKGKNYDIYAYNGGLFAPDEVLDAITIDDELLYTHTLKLSQYDFETDVDVNILGHIFEHSLGEIENVQAEIKGEQVDTQKTKRKKDGIFYTPKYITKYIVENTVGKLCEEKRKEFDIVDEEYGKGRKNRKKDTIKTLDQKLTDYRDWLLTLTILDPACGSGAFLNQALDFLIQEHKKIDQLRAQLFGGGLVFADITNDILEKNIYGVDLNEESVEIAKLSLWLKTAQKGRKLNTLSNNIKCGNSLIDEPEVAGDKAFNWQEEFPHIFAKGGFDVVIGNPPYIRKQGLMENYPELTIFYEDRFQSATGNYDIYALFMERSFGLIKNHGIVSFILPHKFLVADFGEGIRAFFKERNAVSELIHFGSHMVFADASTYTCIINLNKHSKERLLFKKLEPMEINNPFKWDYILYENLDETNWNLQSQKVFELIEKLNTQPYKIETVFDKIFVGLQTSLDAIYVFEGVEEGNIIKGYNSKYNYHFEIEKEIVKPFIKGNEISKFRDLNNTHYVFFPYTEEGISVKEDYILNNLPKTYEYLKHFESEIRGRERGKMDIEEDWYLYIYPKNLNKFHHPKIMTQEISSGCNMTYDENGEFYHPTTIYSFVKNDSFDVDEKFYLGIMNSKVLWFFLKNTGTELRGGYFRFKTNYLKPFPLPEIPDNPNAIIDNVNQMLSLNKYLQQITDKFLRTLHRKFEIEKLSKKLEEWHSLSYKEFTKELSRKKVKLSLSEETEWEDYFLAEKTKAAKLKAEIDKTDKEIDQMVYELYDLTPQEIEIIENSTK